MALLWKILFLQQYFYLDLDCCTTIKSLSCTALNLKAAQEDRVHNHHHPPQLSTCELAYAPCNHRHTHVNPMHPMTQTVLSMTWNGSSELSKHVQTATLRSLKCRSEELCGLNKLERWSPSTFFWNTACLAGKLLLPTGVLLSQPLAGYQWDSAGKWVKCSPCFLFSRRRLGRVNWTPNVKREE